MKRLKIPARASTSRCRSKMAPEWWFALAEAAEENHDPDNYDGRGWDDLTDDEQAEAIDEQMYGMA